MRRRRDHQIIERVLRGKIVHPVRDQMRKSDRLQIMQIIATIRCSFMRGLSVHMGFAMQGVILAWPDKARMLAIGNNDQ
jgi:hypothetical protein